MCFNAMKSAFNPKKKKKADSSKSISPQKIYIYNLNFAKVII